MSTSEIEAAVRGAGLDPLSAEALEKFETYLQLLLKWNSRINLTAVREREAIIHRHFVECIQCAQALPESGKSTLLDFGSGAGLPGIPIAISRQEIRVTLAESKRKKAGFLREAVRTLGLEAEVFDGRVQEMAADQRFGFVTLRAVDKMEESCGVAFGRVAAGGWMVVFATEGTETGLKEALPGIEWRRDSPVARLERGRILMGRRKA